MKKSPMFMIVLAVVVACIVGCNGDTCSCTCCAGNLCTPVLQGTVTVSSCDAVPCKSLCQSKYPQQCVDGSGSASYRCTSDSVLTANWVGVFNMANKCDQRTCCCPVGQIIVSGVDTNSVRVQCSFAGQVCPPEGVTLDQTIAMPNGRSTLIAFLGNLIQATLSQDDRVIQLTNPSFPLCSDSAVRREAVSTAVSTAQINMTLISLLVVLISVKQFRM